MTTSASATQNQTSSTPTTSGGTRVPVLLLASDVDGTLLDNNHEITPENLAAVTAARAAGVTVVLASARGPRSLLLLQQKLNIVGQPVIGYQGSIVGRYALCPPGAARNPLTPSNEYALEILDEHRIDLDSARTIFQVAASVNAAAIWCDGDSWFYLTPHESADFEAMVTGVPPVGQLAFEELHTRTQGPHKIMLPPTPENPAAVAAVLEAMPDGAVAHVSGEGYVEITAPHADKSHGILSLCKVLDIPQSATAAVGDGPNDVGMFAVVARSFAMGNAAPAVKAAAGSVTSSNSDSGLASAIRELLA